MSAYQKLTPNQQKLVRAVADVRGFKAACIVGMKFVAANSRR